jgi:hypothetical protein
VRRRRRRRRRRRWRRRRGGEVREHPKMCQEIQTMKHIFP